jgi:hypothetical protein
MKAFIITAKASLALLTVGCTGKGSTKEGSESGAIFQKES